jgi:hypothetical protein
MSTNMSGGPQNTQNLQNNQKLQNTQTLQNPRNLQTTRNPALAARPDVGERAPDGGERLRMDDDEEILEVEIIEDASADGGELRAEGPRDLEPLFAPEAAAEYRSRWDVVQRDFVDDPARAVRQGNELVAEVIHTLAQTFADERTSQEDGSNRDERGATETLRLAMRRHRALFERLLSV